MAKFDPDKWVQFSVWMKAITRKRLKYAALNRECPSSHIILEALEDWFAKQEKTDG